jgi:hypothetical protein
LTDPVVQGPFSDMSDSRPFPQVLARYSVLKVGAWAAVALIGSGEILREGWANGWSAPAGAVRSGVYLLGYGAAPFVAAIALALLMRVVLSRGVAIQRDQSNLILNLPFGRKIIPLEDGVKVLSELKTIGLPQLGTFLKQHPVVAKQVTFAREGFPDVPFRTGLLTESADIIARRIEGQLR